MLHSTFGPCTPPKFYCNKIQAQSVVVVVVPQSVLQESLISHPVAFVGACSSWDTGSVLMTWHTVIQGKLKGHKARQQKRSKWLWIRLKWS